MEMMKLKVATNRMAGYTGVLGPARFKDGVSVEALPRHIRDRMAASMEFIEIDEDGNEQPAGAQNRMIRNNRETLAVKDELARQSSSEKVKEIAIDQYNATKIPPLTTLVELEEIAGKSGIKGLREIAERWGVKSRSIPIMIQMILAEQSKMTASRNQKLDKETVNVLSDLVSQPADQNAPSGDKPEGEADVEDASEVDPEAALKLAAAAGDFSAALSDKQPQMLIGSDLFNSSYEIEGKVVSLGDLVASAHSKIGGTVEDWNDLDQADRDDLIRIELTSRLPKE